MENLSVEDFFTILGIGVFVVIAVILWRIRDYLITAGAAICHGVATLFHYFFEVREPAIRPATSPAPARTDADAGDYFDWLPDANARDPVRACVRADDAISTGSLVLAPDEIAAVTRMILHNKTLAKPNKLATIQAGWPTIKNRSGDPQSAYARASTIYDALFRPAPEQRYPTLVEQRAKVTAQR